MSDAPLPADPGEHGMFQHHMRRPTSDRPFLMPQQLGMLRGAVAHAAEALPSRALKSMADEGPLGILPLNARTEGDATALC